MTLRIYLVEDHQRIRDQLIPMLQELADCRVIGVAESEPDACQWLKKNAAAWDLVIADLFLQEGSGLAVLRCCRDRTPQQRVVVLTNTPNTSVRKWCEKLGADAVFDKSEELAAFYAFCAA